MSKSTRLAAWIVTLAALGAGAAAGCQKNGDALGGGNGSSAGSAGAKPPAAPAQDLDSKDILARAGADVSAEVDVKHVLIGWKDLAAAYHGRIDPRAAKRTNDDAATLAKDVASKLAANPDSIDALVKQYSEDPGSLGGEPYTVTKDSPFVPEFKKLALRLKVKEVGIVKTDYGYHVMERVAPPPPDPLESADILARPVAEAGPVNVLHVLISWKDAPAARQIKDPRAAAATKADADKIATDVLAKARAGADMTALMKELSEEPHSKESARPAEISADTPMVEPFKNLALRLKIGETGLVKSPFGWHIIQRVPPPAPDSLDSTAILAREPPEAKTKVKHILLGWTDAHTKDPRGAARDRATLEKLVNDTVAKLKGGAKIEPLMAELSEDPGSAKTGISYDATPDASLVPPFKKLALRLKVGEVGVVRTDFGIHIMQRVE